LNTGPRTFSDIIGEICYLPADYPMSADDDSEFARLLTGVKRLHSDRINKYQHRKPHQVVKRIPSQQDYAADSYLPASAASRDSHFNSGLQVKLQRRIRQGAIRPESTLDLHGCRQNEALVLLEEFIADALQRRYRMLLVIHGQGYRSASEAVLKPLLQRWLAEQPQVLAWCPAQVRDGAGGASYVYLRNT
jgi:DNA-nicking Smr family endonuclease